MTTEVIEILARIAEGYDTNQVFFVTDSSDGVIKPKNSLEVYVANDGHMSYGGLALYIRDITIALGREIEYLPLNRPVSDSYISQRNGIVAYSTLGE